MVSRIRSYEDELMLIVKCFHFYIQDQCNKIMELVWLFTHRVLSINVRVYCCWGWGTICDDNCLYLTSDLKNKNSNISLSKHFIQRYITSVQKPTQCWTTWTIYKYSEHGHQRGIKYIYIFSKEHFQTILQIVWLLLLLLLDF